LCKAKPKLILAVEDNIQHILASLALKVTRQSVIIAKLGRTQETEFYARQEEILLGNNACY